MSGRDVCVVDVETTGLDPMRHVVWEWAVVRLRGTEIVAEDSGQILVPELGLTWATPEALKVNGFHGRYTPRTADPVWEAAERLDGLLTDCVLAGNNPAFDAEMIWASVLSECEYEAVPWHYRLLDVRAYLVGWSRAVYPADVSLSTVAADLGLPGQDPAGLHTAMGDARWTADVLRDVWGRSA